MGTHKFTVCLWFDTQAQEAAEFYTSIFKDGKIGEIHRYGKEGFEFHHRPEGSVMTVDFEVNGQSFTALNGGPEFKFNEAISLIVTCDTQEEIDHYWERLTSGGGREVQCGWLTDKYGLSWQIVPTCFQSMVKSADKMAGSRVMSAMFQMKKFDISKLEQAFRGP